jgi:hypothetical protein
MMAIREPKKNLFGLFKKQYLCFYYLQTVRNLIQGQKSLFLQLQMPQLIVNTLPYDKVQMKHVRVRC